MSKGPWRLGSDIGGTFTDFVLQDTATGRLHIEKCLTTPAEPELGVQHGVRALAARVPGYVADTERMFHATTLVTNAVIERKGARTALITTRGFRDVLEIATLRRPLAYSLTQRALEPLVPRSRVVEVDERIDAFGQIVMPLDVAEARRVAAAVASLQPEAVVVSFLFGHLNGSHERALADAIAKLLPEVPLYLGSRINPQIEEYPRTNATVTTAYVGPAVDRYVRALEHALPAMGLTAPLLLMRSDGGIATAQAARENPGAMLLSGPAGGVMAGLEVSRTLGVPELITFDMGGTSADFSLIDGGEARMVNERVIQGSVLRLPSLDIQTISAGGGSIGMVDLGGAIRVGPESASSVPGPACYGRGGTRPTLTDAALVTGMLWGEPMWGTFWVWDARLTSTLIMFFFYLGYLALGDAFEDPERGDRAAAILALVGVVNVPIIKFSVDWWNTLHQPASLTLTKSNMSGDMLLPLFLMMVAFGMFYVTVLIIRVRSELLAAKIRNARMSQIAVNEAAQPAE